MKLLVTLFVLLLSITAASASELEDRKYLLNNRMGAVGAKVQLGSAVYGAVQSPKLVYDFAVSGGAVGTLALSEPLPSKAIITDCVIDVITAMTSQNGGGAITISAETSGDIKAAVDADTLSGRVACIPVGSAATMIKLTAERRVVLEITNSPLTAGKIAVFVQYVLSE